MNQSGMRIQRYFTTEGVNPYDSIKWELRTASIVNSKGETIFEQKDVRVPSGWSQTATNIVVSKYFYGKLDTPERETGVDMLIRRVVDTVTASGVKQGYFDLTVKSADVFHDELSYILLNQLAAFNSPVWFNVGCDKYDIPGNDYKSHSWHWVEKGTTFPEHSDVRYEATGYKNPQCSACFINSIEDTMEGIMHLATTEAMLFKFGSGTGTNFSALRSSKEGVSGGGMASGPLSFMKGLDAFAGVIKSGGKTRRAAKMAILNAHHPDIEEFIDCKVVEDRKAQALMREGYDGTSGPDSPAYSSIFYQNANNSVRVSDEFMVRATSVLPFDWALKAVKDGRVLSTVSASGLLRKISEATWECGDPGMQFDDTINKWHTCKATARINSSNPCSEYMFLDDTACNLASLNLMKFVADNGEFDHHNFSAAVDIMILAQDILIDLAGYPTESIARNSHDYRPLGLGYANLGALLMSMGLAYDSDAGRLYAGVITAIMTGEAYLISSKLAAFLKPLKPAGVVETIASPTDLSSGYFPGYHMNADSFMGVMELHSSAAYDLRKECLESKHTELIALSDFATNVWDCVTSVDKSIGFRNSQVTVLAPTGTIGFMMDCDTTGIEPELSLIKFKKMVGGGQMKIVNQTVPTALKKLGYTSNEIESILVFIDTECTPEGSGIKTEHLAIFDTAFRPMNSTRSIAYEGHIRMMAAAQPFLSGAISKTVNVPTEAAWEEIEKAYVLGWKLGLKAIAIYRDGSKSNQVLVSKVGTADGLVPNEVIQHMLEHREQEPPSKEFLDVLSEQFGPYLVPDGPIDDPEAPPRAVRHKLPDTRPALTHKFSIVGHDGYIIVGLYPNGQPGEIFITMAKEGSTISGFMDCFALVFSIALQHGVPLEVLVSKLANTRFEPSGWTGDPKIGYAKSIMDYLARWLKSEYLVPRASALFPTESKVVKPDSDPKSMSDMFADSDAPPCPDCGSMTVRNGSCYKCIECGSTTGCS